MERRAVRGDMAEVERQARCSKQYGVVSAVNYKTDPPVIQVQFGVDLQGNPLTTHWIPWLEERAGADKTWHAPEIGDQVDLEAPHGDFEFATVGGQIYSKANKPPTRSPDQIVTMFKDGGFSLYDRIQHSMTFFLPAGGSFGVVIDGQKALSVTAAESVIFVGGQPMAAINATGILSAASVQARIPMVAPEYAKGSPTISDSTPAIPALKPDG